MRGRRAVNSESWADNHSRYPCKGCGEILEEGKAFVSVPPGDNSSDIRD